MKKRTYIGSFVLCFLIMTTTFLVGPVFQSQAIASSKEIKIAAVFQYAYIDFFVPTRMGTQDAAEEYGIQCNFVGPPDQSTPAMISMVETLIAKGIDGLIVEASSPPTLLPIVSKARDKGIPVVVTNELVEHEGFDGFCGADPIAIGKLMGQELEKAMNGKGPWAKKVGYQGGELAGKVAYILDNPGAANVEKRIVGAREYLKNFPKIEDAGKYDSTPSVDKAREVINNILTANPDLKALVNVSAGNTVASGMVVEERNLEGKLIVIGMDLLPHALRLIQKGLITVTIGQNPYGQGYLPVKAIAEYLIDGKPIPRMMPTELEVVDLSNVDSVLEREVDFLEKGKKLKKD